MLTLLDLGEDILASNICSYLSPYDTFSLSLTCKLIHQQLTTNDAYRRLFQLKFGKITPLSLKDYDWKRLFQLRSSKNVNFYSWGSPQLGRLGYLLKDIPQEHRAPLLLGVHTPTKVPNFENFTIDQILTGGYSFQLLLNGDIYCTSASYKITDGPAAPGPRKSDSVTAPFEISDDAVTAFPLLSRRFNRTVEPIPQGPRAPDNPNLRLPPLEMTFPPSLKRQPVEESSFVTKMELPPTEDGQSKCISISSGRLHFIGLDDRNRVYTWDSGNYDWRVGVQIVFNGLHGTITKILAGWNSSVCFMSGVGLIVWCCRDSIAPSSTENGNQSEAHYVVIPDLTSVIDFIALCDCVIYIKGDGELYRYDTVLNEPSQSGMESSNTPYPIVGFNRWLSRYNKKNSVISSFTKITGCYKSFALFTQAGLVLLGDLHSSGSDSHGEPNVLPELQNTGVIHVVIGDYHLLALTDKGDLLSWGLEPQSCGCLGLGYIPHLLKADETSATQEGRNWRVHRPTLVKKPTENGMWLAVVAAGWHSAGLFVST